MVTAVAFEVDRTRRIRHLRLLIQALDRRVPHFERDGEAAIARDAADLKHRAIERLRTLGDAT